MSAEAKRVKALILVELLLGALLMIFGVVLAIMGAQTAAPYALCAEGLVTSVFGVRGALIANVPARIGKIVTKGLVVLLFQIACVVGIVFLLGPNEAADDPLPVCAAAVPAVITVVAVLLAHGMAKRAER